MGKLVFFDIGQSLLVDFDLRASTRLVFLTLFTYYWWTLTCAFPLILFVLFDIGQPLLADFDLCVPTHLVFLTLVSHSGWTLTCAFPLVFSFSHWSTNLKKTRHCHTQLEENKTLHCPINGLKPKRESVIFVG